MHIISSSNVPLRRVHGWQLPLHPLQIVGISVFCFLVAAFYCFLGLFLGNRIAEITVNTIFSFSACCSALLFVRCSATDPADKTRLKRKKNDTKKKNKRKRNSIPMIYYGYVLTRILLRFFRKIERCVLRIFIRRKYFDHPWNTMVQIEQPLIPFPLILESDSVALNSKHHETSFCSHCDFEVDKYSKHCRTCNKCIQGFDHHCRWLNNCVGKRNYTPFFLLMIFVLIMLVVEGGTAIAVFIRCFTDKNGIEHELIRRHYARFPRELLATLSIILLLMTLYGSAALGQLFFFHVLLIKKGISTYEYILAMRENNQSLELESSLEDSDYCSDDDGDEDEVFEDLNLDSPEKTTCATENTDKNEMTQLNPHKFSIRIDGDSEHPGVQNKKQAFHASINPWKLLNLSRDKAVLAGEKAREKLHKQQTSSSTDKDPLKPLPLETKSGPLVKSDKHVSSPTMSMGRLMINQTSSPRRRLSCSPIQQPVSNVPSPKNRYRSDFDLKLTKMSKELETYISRQVLCSVLNRDVGTPR